jgi:hypothetical protein
MRAVIGSIGSTAREARGGVKEVVLSGGEVRGYRGKYEGEVYTPQLYKSVRTAANNPNDQQGFLCGAVLYD